MLYKPDLILKADFGKYNEKGDLSVAQLVLRNPGGFPYFRHILMKQLEEGREVSMHPEDFNQMGAMISGFGKFDVNVKCQGKNGECKENASHLLLPYKVVDNFRKDFSKRPGEMPDQINLTDPQISEFRCGECAEEMRYERGKCKSLDIGFKLPGEFTEECSKDHWSVDKGKIHIKMRDVANALLSVQPGGQIDPGKIKKRNLDKYNSQKIVSLLLHVPGKYGVEKIPYSKGDYVERGIRWGRFTKKDYNLSEEMVFELERNEMQLRADL